MKIIVLATLGAIALTAVGCAAPPDEEPTEQTSEALWNTGGGGDPDDCTAARYGCYASCAKTGSASCYHYCDIVYARCRGLPEPELIGRAAFTSPSVEALR